MSSANDSEVEDLREERDQLRERVDALEDLVEDLAGRVDELEAEAEETATVEWSGPNPAEMRIESADGSNTVYPYEAITTKADADTVDLLDERLTQVEEGEAEVVVRSEMDRDALPIESKIAQRQSGTGGLTANEERATLVFPAFGGKARSWSGKMRLDSTTVREILADKTDKSATRWNRNTILRTMEQVAKNTSTKEEGERDPYDEDNLLTLEKGDKRLELVANRDEWMEWNSKAGGET